MYSVMTSVANSFPISTKKISRFPLNAVTFLLSGESGGEGGSRVMINWTLILWELLIEFTYLPNDVSIVLNRCVRAGLGLDRGSGMGRRSGETGLDRPVCYCLSQSSVLTPCDYHWERITRKVSDLVSQEIM